jgi:2-dehydropantoate 2-reductase
MRIAIFGAGAVGGYFGARLAQAGEEVAFIARGAQLAALLQDGLRLESPKGDLHLHPVPAFGDPRQVGPVDIVLLAVKAWSVPEAAPALRPLLDADTGVIFLGNGVDAPGQLTAALGAQHVLGGLCRISAFIAAPGHIRHVGIEPFVAFGELDGSLTPRVERLRQAFEHAGVTVSVPADIQAAIWDKFIFIASISGVGAVTRVPVGDFRDLPGTRQMLRSALEEIAALAAARNVRLPDDIVEKTLAFIDNMASGVTASMQRDILEGRPSELESQNGAVMRLGLESGVPTPTHAFIYHALLPQELQARRAAQG